VPTLDIRFGLETENFASSKHSTTDRNDSKCAPANGSILPATTKKSVATSPARPSPKLKTAPNALAGASTLQLPDHQNHVERPDVPILNAWSKDGLAASARRVLTRDMCASRM
jgi:hypothetical protein